MKRPIPILAGVSCGVFLGVAGFYHMMKSFDGFQQKIQTSEARLVKNRKELISLRRENRVARHLMEKNLNLSSHLRENACREADVRMSMMEEKLRSNRKLAREELALLHRTMRRNPEQIRHKILSPSIQVSAQSGIGGGTVIGCRKKGPDDYETFIITAFHVVEKAVMEKDGKTTLQKIDIRTYDAEGRLADEDEADIIAHHREKDLALLCLRRTRPFPVVARLASRDALKNIRVFTPIYAVGCPLGHPPLPSLGEISTLRKQVDGERFWMMNAPTFFGNSGGGIFHRETHELIGISAMICTYDGFVSVPVPHLGIMVSLETVYDWLDGQYLQYTYNPGFTPQLCRELRRETSRPHPPHPPHPFPRIRY